MFKLNPVLSGLTAIVGIATLVATASSGSRATSSTTLAITPTLQPLPTLAVIATTQPSLITLEEAPVSVKTAPIVSVKSVQPSVLLNGIQMENQGWNNCGPASMVMVLGYYGRDDTQQDIAAFTKPDPNDANVSAAELVAYANENGMLGLSRENGTMERLKELLSNGLPVIIETGMSENATDGWIGHDKVLIGYDDKEFTFMDPLDGPDQKVPFDAMDTDWKALNRRYIIIYPPDMEPAVRAILGDELVDMTMYKNAVTQARAEIAANSQDAFAWFNLGTDLNGLQQYEDAAAAFDRARGIGLPWRMIWYQFGPYVAYLQTGRNNDVIALANTTLANANNLEESHYYKAMALSALGQGSAARIELQTALRYNKNYVEAQLALQGFSTPH